MSPRSSSDSAPKTRTSAASKVRMNSRPMILRFSSGSWTPASASRNWSAASTTSRASKTSSKSRSTCSVSPLRIIPWSTYTQVSRSPMARCTMAAATAESTPPESAQIARPRSPTCSRIRSTCSSTMLTIVQVWRQPAISCRKCSSTCWPCSEWRTSGCHWTPASPRPTSSKAATGVTSVDARTVKPVGSRGDRVAVRHPDVVGLGQAGEQRAGRGDGDRRAAVLTRAGVGDLAAEPLGHQLEAVAHAEDGDPRGEDRVVDAGRTLGVDRRRTAAEDDRLGLARQHLRDRHRVRHDLGVDPRLAHPAGDQLGVLGAEVDDEDEVVVRGRRSPSKGTESGAALPSERARHVTRARPGREDGRALMCPRAAGQCLD